MHLYELTDIVVIYIYIILYNIYTLFVHVNMLIILYNMYLT